ncbi:MAG: alkane 1-monooxygenase, partial [Xanthomarina sp.]
MKDLKYLAALSLPFMAIIGVYFKGYYVFLTPVYAFVLIPILDLLFPMDPSNLDSNEIANSLKNKVFDWLLYLNLPVIYAILVYALFIVNSTNLALFEIIGLVFSVGIVLAVNGINVAHELGHRQTTNERFIGKALLLPSFYM